MPQQHIGVGYRPPLSSGAALVAMGLSAVVAIGAATTELQSADNQQVFPTMVRRLEHHNFLPTVWSMAFGRAGIAVYLATVVASAFALIVCVRRMSEPAISPEFAGAVDESR